MKKADNRILILHTPMGESTSYKKFKEFKNLLEYDHQKNMIEALRSNKRLELYRSSRSGHHFWGQSLMATILELERDLDKLRRDSINKKYTVIDGIINNPFLKCE